MWNYWLQWDPTTQLAFSWEIFVGGIIPRFPASPVKKNKYFQGAVWHLGGKKSLFQRDGMKLSQEEQAIWEIKWNFKDLSIKMFVFVHRFSKIPSRSVTLFHTISQEPSCAIFILKLKNHLIFRTDSRMSLACSSDIIKWGQVSWVFGGFFWFFLMRADFWENFQF